MEIQPYEGKIKQATTDEQVISLWLGTKNVASTNQAYAHHIGDFMEYMQMPVSVINLAAVQTWHRMILATSYAERTKAQKIAAIRSFFKFAKDIGYIQFNPATLLPLPKIKDDLAERILSHDEVRKIILTEKNPQHKAMLMLLYETGIRVSELCGLKWKDVKSGSSRDEFVGQITVMGKGGKTRAVKIRKRVWKALERIKVDSPDAPVFSSKRTGRHLSRQWIHRVIKRAGIRVGIPGLSPHWFRHSHASHSIEGGASLPLVKSTLGHASITSTDRYLHVRPDDSSGRFLEE